MGKNEEIGFSRVRYIPVAMAVMVLTGVLAASAVDEATSPVDGMDDAPTPSSVIQRDPFWPVGFEPKRSVVTETTDENVTVRVEQGTDWNKAMEQVAIQGVSSKAGHESYAIINGQVKSVGETVTIRVGEINYTWMIEGISPPSSVNLRRLSAQ